ncbi:hypothetical protein [Naumannella cuiyingiana]|uniref:Antitoxin Xre/MbcA/ParS-like toxin-binding domain-containing protein n=1 Tax=Naumannella cuiyingiana TaxID=1347891 RepID=A0A7Z0D7N2_9ACTN|nr:hypothetical protein [Naumannella cuiyingiana]NYI70403.1 hypothetical protein [Naumannella cuiyingiana]
MVTTLDQRAHKESVTLPVASLTEELRDRLGATLVAYIAGVKETRAVRQWAHGEREPSAAVVQRLRLSHQISTILGDRHGSRVVQAWMQGLNPDLGDIAPARILRESDIDEIGERVLGAARHFAAA